LQNLLLFQDFRNISPVPAEFSAQMLFAVVDFETTGLSVATDQIVQIGIACYRKEDTDGDAKNNVDDGVKGIANGIANDIANPTFSTYVKSEKKISTGASKVTGITDEKIANAPTTIDALRAMFKFIQDTRSTAQEEPVTLVAYNGLGFDFPILLSELQRVGLDPSSVLRSAGISSFVDPFRWAKSGTIESHLKRGTSGTYSYKLSNVYEQITGMPLEGAHEAMADVKATCVLLKHPSFSEMSVARGTHFKNLVEMLLDFEARKTTSTKKRTWTSISTQLGRRNSVQKKAKHEHPLPGVNILPSCPY
jgi:DNA polymerase III epsilon subunit-like protein